jgi:hypothetical protein
MKSFIDKYEEDKDISCIAPFVIFKAKYEIGCNKNISKGILLAKEAIDSPWRNTHIQNIADILLINKDNIPFVEEFLDNLPRDVSEIVILKIKSDISHIKEDYPAALDYIEKAYEKKWDFGSYILAKAYSNLLAKNYRTAIDTIDNNIDKIKDFREKDVLIINREIAKKKLKLETKKHEIRSILAHQKSKGDVAMCAFFLLDEEKNGVRQLDSLIGQNFMNYYRFLEWPALPENILSKYSPVKNIAA